MAKVQKTKDVGALVLERIRAIGSYQAEVCRATGVPPNVLSSVIHNARGLGAKYATALGKHLGIDPALFDRRAQVKRGPRPTSARAAA